MYEAEAFRAFTREPVLQTNTFAKVLCSLPVCAAMQLSGRISSNKANNTQKTLKWQILLNTINSLLTYQLYYDHTSEKNYMVCL